MKAVGVLPGSRQVQLVETKAPQISMSGEVKLWMLDVGICGTDREICAFDYGTPPLGSNHLILGHVQGTKTSSHLMRSEAINTADRGDEWDDAA